MYNRRPSSALAAAASVWAAAGEVPLVSLMVVEARLSARLSTAEDMLMAEDTRSLFELTRRALTVWKRTQVAEGCLVWEKLEEGGEEKGSLVP